MNQLLSIFALVTLGGILSLAGGFLVLIKEKTLRPFYLYLVAFAAGVLVSTSLFDLLPEAIEHAETIVGFEPFTIVAVGIAVFFILEKLVHSYHDHTGGDEHHGHPSIVPLIAIGDGLHNFIDGGVITAAVLVDPKLGLLTALAVFVHEFAQEVGDMAVLLHSGLTRAKAAIINVLSASTVYLGMLTVLVLSRWFEAIEPLLVAFTAGAFLFIAIGELLPEVTGRRDQTTRSWLIVVAFLLGLSLVKVLGTLIQIEH